MKKNIPFRNVVHEDIRCKSYGMRKGNFLLKIVKENCLLKSNKFTTPKLIPKQT